MGFDYVWAVIQMAKLLLLLSAAQLARSSHRVVLIHPTCELWIWQYDVSLDSYVDLGDFSLLTIRELFATTINAGSNGLFTLKHEFVKPANVLSDTFCTFSGPNAPLALWSNSQNALFVNISSVLNRKKLLLIRDFEFVMSGLSETHWLLIREGDDVSESVAEFISTYAPGLSEEAKRLSFIEMLNEINTSLHNRKNIEDKLKVAAEESVNLQGALNIFVGDTSDRLSHIAGKAWLHFSINTVDLTSADSLLLFTGGISSVNNIVAEHVWEHMTIAESIVAAINCWEALAPGGILRLAVPDYNWAINRESNNLTAITSKIYSPSDRIAALALNGRLNSDIKDSHLVQWSVCSLIEILLAAGFRRDDITPVEYTDSYGRTTIAQWNESHGPIRRSSKGAIGKSVSIIIDARKTTGVEAVSREVVLAIDCTDISLLRSAPEMWPDLIDLIRVQLSRKIGNHFKIVVFLSSISDISVSMENNIQERWSVDGNYDILIEFTYISSPNISSCSVSPKDMIYAMFRAMVTHLITGNVYFELCSSWKEFVAGVDVVTLHTKASDEIIESSCRLPYVSSSLHSVKRCNSSRLGLLISNFGHDISDEMIEEVRKKVAATAASISDAHVFMNNPYIVVPISNNQCKMLRHATDWSKSATFSDLTNQKQMADMEFITMLWNVIDGIVEGSANFDPALRPWVVLLGNCEWESLRHHYQLQSILWIGVKESLDNSNFRKVIISGALTSVILPDLIECTAKLGCILSYPVYLALKSLALGCPVMIGTQISDFFFENVTHSDKNGSGYSEVFLNDSVLYLRSIEPLAVWSAIRFFLFKRLGSINNAQTKSSLIRMMRSHFLGWNEIAATVLKHVLN